MIYILKMGIEFRKGLLFIRLNGTLTKDTSEVLSNSLDYFIGEAGIKYFVINIKELSYLDQEGISLLKEKYKDMILHNGNMVICGYENPYVEEMIQEQMKNVYQTKDELKAFQILQI